jgi:cytochrome bd-type quinol oxidase subunit 1
VGYIVDVGWLVLMVGRQAGKRAVVPDGLIVVDVGWLVLMMGRQAGK